VCGSWNTAGAAADKGRQGKAVDAVWHMATLLRLDRESKRVLLWWHWSSAEDPNGGFHLTWDVKPISALKSQTQDYVAEEEDVADLKHDFCGSHGLMLSPALRAGGRISCIGTPNDFRQTDMFIGTRRDTQLNIVILQTASAGHVT
jgi:hypothetical protein